MGWNFLERYMNLKKFLLLLLPVVVVAAPPLPDPTGKAGQVLMSDGTSWTITNTLTGVNTIKSAATVDLVLGTTTFGTVLTFTSSTGNASFVGTISSQQATVRANSIGVTSTDGTVLQNLTAAALGAQQWSPRTHWIGQGWETSTSASQTVDFWAEAQPVQGSTNPSGNWVLSSRINGGGTTALVTVTSAGTTSIAGSLTVTGGITSSGSGISNSLTNNGTQAIVGPTTNTPLFIVTNNTTAITVSAAQVVSTAGQLTVGGALALPGGSLSIFQTNATMTNGAGAQIGTLTNSPVAGNPTTWFAINDNGTVRHVPAW